MNSTFVHLFLAHHGWKVYETIDDVIPNNEIRESSKKIHQSFYSYIAIIQVQFENRTVFILENIRRKLDAKGL